MPHAPDYYLRVGEMNGSAGSAAIFHWPGVAVQLVQKGEMTAAYTRSMCGQPLTDYYSSVRLKEPRYSLPLSICSGK